MNVHVAKAYQEELNLLDHKIAQMGGLTEHNLGRAFDALNNHDPQLAERVIMSDAEIDRLQAEIEDQVISMIALRAPLAEDLRHIMAALKITGDLERIGDLAKNIAKRAVYLAEGKPGRISASLVRMGQQTMAQLTEILDAYVSRDTDLAVAIWRRDAELDETYNAIFREVVTYMMEDARLIGLGSQLLFIAKNLERIGDHTTHVAENIYYIVKGEPLGDDRPKGEPIGLDLTL